MKEYLLPAKIVAATNVSNPEGLFIDKGLYPTHDGDPSHWGQLTRLDEGSSLTMDFGQEMSGFIIIYTGWILNSICKVRIRFGESLGEVNSSIGEKNACNAHSLRDFETLLPASGEAVFGPSGFRYLRIDVIEPGKYVYLRNIFCENHIFSGSQIYQYSGKDPEIARIFNVAKRTLDLCAGLGYLVDGVKRDRLAWIGDLAPEVMALTTLYKEANVVSNTIEIAKKQFPLPRFMNDLATYSLWLIILMAELYRTDHEKEYVISNKDYLIQLLKHLEVLIDEDGNIVEGYRHLVDWPTNGSVDEEVGIRCIFIMAMNDASYLFKELGIKDTSSIETIRHRALKKPFEVKEMKQVVGLKYSAFGKISDDEYQLLIKNGAHGFSTFMSYYILNAIASRDEDLAVKLMKEYYGAMLDKGATTFWEDFNLDWCEGSGRIDEINPNLKDIHGDYGAHCYIGYRHSLCHGWGCGVIKFIKEHC